MRRDHEPRGEADRDGPGQGGRSSRPAEERGPQL